MDQTADDPSSLDGESSRGAGCVFYSIRYFLTEKARVRIASFESQPSSSAKKQKLVFVIVLHEG